MARTDSRIAHHADHTIDIHVIDVDVDIDSMPPLTGVQLVGRHLEEPTLLRLAAQLEEARPWITRRPRGLEGLESPRRTDG